ncbi:MAG: 50S ribosomal protein L25, partial [Candidatus Altimarinota bacterium]
SEEKASHLRQKSLVPGVIYGHGFENIHVKVDYHTFRRVFEQATYSTLVGLDVDGKEVPVLIHEVQYDPITDNIIHIDFHAVRMDEKVTTHIALEFVGVSEAVKQGAVLNTLKHEVEVSALPGDLVHTIQVDISALNEVGDIIRISDITPPKGVEILANPEEPLISAVELKVVEEVPAAAEAAAPAEGADKTEGAEKKAE